MHRLKIKFSYICLIMIFMFILVSCGKKDNEGNEIQLYFNKETIQKQDVIEKLVKSYEEISKKKIKVIGVSSEEEIKKHISEKEEAKLIILDGYAFYDFVENDLLRDLSYLYKAKQTREKFSIITNVYPRQNGKYWGIGIMPFSLDLVLNTDLLSKLGINIEEDNLSTAILKLKEKGVKISTHIKSEYSKELLLSALIANDTIIYDLSEQEITGVLEQRIKSIKDGQKIFDKMHEFYQIGSFREENFVEGNKDIIKEFNEGKVPAVLTTTLASNEFNSEIKTMLINELPIENKYVNAAVGIDIIFTSSIGNSNTRNIDNFLRYLIQGGGIENLAEDNRITGNKYGDSSLAGIQGKMASSINSADQINKLYFNVISNKNIWIINDELVNVMNGKYDGHEWERILKKATLT